MHNYFPFRNPYRVVHQILVSVKSAVGTRQGSQPLIKKRAFRYTIIQMENICILSDSDRSATLAGLIFGAHC